MLDNKEIFFDKKPNETNEAYINRICSTKDRFGLTWDDVANIINIALDCKYSESYYRKHYRKNLVDDLIGCLHEDTREDEIRTMEDVLADIRVAKQRQTDERRATNDMLRRMSREDTIKEIALEVADKISDRIILDGYDFDNFHYPSDKTAILNLSDWHYGIEINNYWNQYSIDEARKRINHILQETMTYCVNNKVSKLHVLNIGDLISGRIHSDIRIDNQEDVITQIIEVSEIMAEFLDELSKIVTVEFHTVSDNHSRIEPNKKESLDLESLHRIVPWFVNTRLADNKNITICDNKYDGDIAVFDCDGWTVAMAHGNKDTISNITSHLSLMTGEHIDLICTAHMHHFACDEVNQCLVVSNPSLMGTDTYAKNKRLTSRPAQTLILVGKKAPIESIYYIVC